MKRFKLTIYFLHGNIAYFGHKIRKVSDAKVQFKNDNKSLFSFRDIEINRNFQKSCCYFFKYVYREMYLTVSNTDNINI